MSWNQKHLLDIESLSAEEITTVLDTAREFKAVGERAIKKVPALQGKTVVNFFVEPSTRTRVSFELSAKRLSADIINFAADASSFQKGESLKDTAERVLPYFKKNIAPELTKGLNILVAAHGNSLRALVMKLENINTEEIVKLEIATGVPLVYKFEKDKVERLD